MKYKFLFAFTLMLLSCYAKANGNTDPGVGEECKKSDIAGGVFHSENKKPLGNVHVTAYNSNKKEKAVVTDAQGNFSFDDLKPGTYKFVFEKAGFRKVTREKTITKVDEGIDMTVLLDEHDAIDITPGPGQFFNFD
jgi:hypothetical protein